MLELILLKSLIFLVPCFFVISFASGVFAETLISGYGSFVANKAVVGDRFLSDYSRPDICPDDWVFAADSLFGIRVVQVISFDYSYVVQLIAHGVPEYNPEISREYVNYWLTSEPYTRSGK